MCSNGTILYNHCLFSELAICFFFLITMADYTFLTLYCYLGLALLLICGAYANTFSIKSLVNKSAAKEANPLKAALDKAYKISPDVLEAHLKSLEQLLNDIVKIFRSLFSFEDNFTSLKFAALLWILSIVGGWFSGALLLYMAFLTAFTWPRLYLEKRREIDNVWNLVATQIDTVILSKIPFGKKKKNE
eukprot:TRINITY_DN1920_c0_g1_i3.p1 TRINITY_DN1920_c0_g1~~TRINITY_DN1920_c0_g1_i3.p1  ORF type:complete len:189 (-),score=14.27 TRINITY_DN1920_c0_g1_i3:88-654(-)